MDGGQQLAGIGAAGTGCLLGVGLVGVPVAGQGPVAVPASVMTLLPGCTFWVTNEVSVAWVAAGSTAIRHRPIPFGGRTSTAMPVSSLLRCAFSERCWSMIGMLRWVQMASARSSSAARSLWWLGTSVAMSS